MTAEMGVLFSEKPVKLIVSLIFREETPMGEAEKRLKDIFGPTDTLEKNMPFDYTDYYSEEFGEPLRRKLISFSELIPKDNIAKVKLATNGIENGGRIKGKRTVNIDPGYITEAKLVLLTTKDYTHRVYIGEEIFAESTLFYQDGSFRSWPWTYPDYASRELISYFNGIRDMYMRGLKTKEAGGR